MKTLLILFIFSMSAITMNAQDKELRNNSTTTNQTSIKNKDIKNSAKEISEEKKDEQRICHAEISKVSFYRALIEKNGFDIEIKDTNQTKSRFALRSTEQIITRNKKQIAYVD